MNKIDNLMQLFDNVLGFREGTDSHDKAVSTFRSALVAALKPGEPVARFNWNSGGFEWLTKYDFEKHNMHPLYLAPPAQTPTVKEYLKVQPDTHCWDEDEQQDVWSYSKPMVEQMLAERDAVLRLALEAFDAVAGKGKLCDAAIAAIKRVLNG